MKIAIDVFLYASFLVQGISRCIHYPIYLLIFFFFLMYCFKFSDVVVFFFILLFVAWLFISQCLFSGDNPGVGIALDGRALGGEGMGGLEEESYWNHRNAAPVGSITFLEKQKTRRGGEGREGRREGGGCS